MQSYVVGYKNGIAVTIGPSIRIVVQDPKTILVHGSTTFAWIDKDEMPDEFLLYANAKDKTCILPVFGVTITCRNTVNTKNTPVDFIAEAIGCWTWYTKEEMPWVELMDKNGEFML